MAFVLASAYGVLMELLQLWIRSALRSFKLGYVVANCIGVPLGIFAGAVYLSMALKKNTDETDVTD